MLLGDDGGPDLSRAGRPVKKKLTHERSPPANKRPLSQSSSEMSIQRDEQDMQGITGERGFRGSDRFEHVPPPVPKLLDALLVLLALLPNKLPPVFPPPNAEVEEPKPR